MGYMSASVTPPSCPLRRLVPLGSGGMEVHVYDVHWYATSLSHLNNHPDVKLGDLRLADCTKSIDVEEGCWSADLGAIRSTVLVVVVVVVVVVLVMLSVEHLNLDGLRGVLDCPVVTVT